MSVILAMIELNYFYNLTLYPLSHADNVTCSCMKLVMFVETVSFLIMRMLGWALDQLAPGIPICKKSTA